MSPTAANIPKSPRRDPEQLSVASRATTAEDVERSLEAILHAWRQA